MLSIIYTLLTLKYGVNLLNVPLASVLQRENAFFHCVTLTRVLFPQMISYSDAEVLVLVLLNVSVQV